MSDPIVNVTVKESDLVVKVEDNTPNLTITDNETNKTTVINSQVKTVKVGETPPEVTVFLGSDRGFTKEFSYDVNKILSLMVHDIGSDQLTTTINTQLSNFQNLYDGYSTTQSNLLSSAASAATVYTDSQIDSVDVNVNALLTQLPITTQFISNTNISLGNINQSIGDNTQEIGILQSLINNFVLPAYVFNNLSSEDLADLVLALTGQLTPINFDAATLATWNNLVDLYNEYGDDQTLMIGKINTAFSDAVTYCDSQTANLNNAINANVTNVDNLTTSLSITDGKIESVITDYITIGDVETAYESRVTQTEQSISTLVSQTTTSIDNVTNLRSTLDQTASDITARVEASEQNGTNIITNSSEIQLNKDSITQYVDSYDSAQGLLNSSMTRLTALEATTQITNQQLNGVQTTLTSIQTQTASSWEVGITEDTGGNTYTTGFSLKLYPDWMVEHSYVVDNNVCLWINGVLHDYVCIQDNIADDVNKPSETGGASYWNELPDATKSAFTILADQFSVTSGNGDGVFTPFEINIDSETGQAFLNMNGTVTFGSGSSGYSNLTDIPTSLDDINSDEFADLQIASTGVTLWFFDVAPSLTTEPTSDWATDTDKDNHLKDLYYDQFTGFTYQFNKDTDGNYSWDKLQDTDTINALETAQAAGETADNKKRVFVSTPTVSYDVGDLWVDESDPDNIVLKYATTAKADPDTFNADDWSIASTNGMTQTQQTIVDDLVVQVDSKICSYIQEDSPTWTDADSNHVDDLWYKPSLLTWYKYDGANWIEADISIADINTLADGKTTLFYGASTPANPVEGDYWINELSGQITWQRYSGGSWVSSGAYMDGADVTSDQDLAGIINTGTTTINGGSITNDSITTNHLTVNSITTEKINDNAVTIPLSINGSEVDFSGNDTKTLIEATTFHSSYSSVLLQFSATYVGTSSGNGTLELKLKRGDTQLLAPAYTYNDSGSSISFSYISTSPNEYDTYSVVAENMDSYSLRVENINFSLLAAKK